MRQLENDYFTCHHELSRSGSYNDDKTDGLGV